MGYTKVIVKGTVDDYKFYEASEGKKAFGYGRIKVDTEVEGEMKSFKYSFACFDAIADVMNDISKGNYGEMIFKGRLQNRKFEAECENCGRKKEVWTMGFVITDISLPKE